MNDLLYVAKMSRTTFYYQQVKRDYTQVKEAILSLYHESKQRNGYHPLRLKLRQMSFHLNHKTVMKLFICSILRRKRWRKLGKTSLIAPKVLNRDFTLIVLNQKWGNGCDRILGWTRKALLFAIDRLI